MDADVALEPYPDIVGCESAFIGFCGGFDGRQDCSPIAAAGVCRVVAVDRDPARIAGMPDLYPDSWRFVEADVYSEASKLSDHGQRFDLVSLDPYTSDMEECAQWVALWCSLASIRVVIGTQRHTEIYPPEPWTILENMQRSTFNGGVYWTVLGIA